MDGGERGGDFTERRKKRRRNHVYDKSQRFKCFRRKTGERHQKMVDYDFGRRFDAFCVDTLYGSTQNLDSLSRISFGNPTTNEFV